MSSRVPLRVSDSDVSVVRAEVSRLEAAYKNYEAGRKWGIGGRALVTRSSQEVSDARRSVGRSVAVAVGGMK